MPNCAGTSDVDFQFNLNRRLGGRSLNREIVSFRFVRSCMRARGLAVRWKSGSNRVRPLSLFPFLPPGFPFFLAPLPPTSYPASAGLMDIWYNASEVGGKKRSGPNREIVSFRACGKERSGEEERREERRGEERRGGEERRASVVLVSVASCGVVFVDSHGREWHLIHTVNVHPTSEEHTHITDFCCFARNFQRLCCSVPHQAESMGDDALRVLRAHHVLPVLVFFQVQHAQHL